MNVLANIRLRELTIGMIICCIVYFEDAVAETLVYRFEAEQVSAPIVPPANSVTSLAAAAPRLSGTFGFDTDAPTTANASIPGQVSFSDYKTGFITIDSINTSGALGEVHVQVTDSVAQTDEPQMGRVDEVSFGTSAISTNAPIDALSVRLRYVDAKRLDGVGLPQTLNIDDLARKSLIFSTRVDTLSNRSEGQAATTGAVLGLVNFDITVIERIE